MSVEEELAVIFGENDLGISEWLPGRTSQHPKTLPASKRNTRDELLEKSKEDRAKHLNTIRHLETVKEKLSPSPTQIAVPRDVQEGMPEVPLFPEGAGSSVTADERQKKK